jgi:uncharacterized membrane protein
MAAPKDSFRLEHAVHLTLLAGLAASGVLLIAGLALSLAHGHSQPSGPPPPLAVILRGALREDGISLINLGLLVLILTPLMRVLVLALGWTAQRQWRFAAVSCTVLGLLILSLVLGVG